MTDYPEASVEAVLDVLLPHGRWRWSPDMQLQALGRTHNILAALEAAGQWHRPGEHPAEKAIAQFMEDRREWPCAGCGYRHPSAGHDADCRWEPMWAIHRMLAEDGLCDWCGPRNIGVDGGRQPHFNSYRQPPSCWEPDSGAHHLPATEALK